MGDVKVLQIGPRQPKSRQINLRDLGFSYQVSDHARAEIAANERRARKVLETAHLFWFGRKV